MQIVQASAAAQADAEAPETNCRTTFQFQLAISMPDISGNSCTAACQLRLLRLAEGGGEPPVCSKIRAAGPPSPKAAAHLPMV